jgi:hypothetical protein
MKKWSREDVGVARAILLAQRRRLMAEREIRPQWRRPPDDELPVSLERLAKRLRCQIYPATRGPDEQLDRLGYGEEIVELRRAPDDEPIERRVWRTRSGGIMLGGTQTEPERGPEGKDE